MSCSACGAKFEAPVNGACPSCGARFDNLPAEAVQAPAAVPAPPPQTEVFSAPAASVQPVQASASGPAKEARAGFWIRLAAHVVDSILLAVANLLLDAAGVKGLDGMLLSLIVGATYYVGLTANGGQTAGKKLVGIRVIMVDGSPVTWGRSFLRWIGYLLSGLPLGLGYVWAGVTKPKRAWHDLIAGTKVVYTDPAAAVQGVAYAPEDDKAGGIAICLMVATPLLLIAGIGITAALFIPKFANLQGRSDEGGTKGSLGTIRAALSIYYGDLEGVYPSDLDALTAQGKYLSSLPAAKLSKLHPASNRVSAYPSRSQAASADEGGWAYIDNPADSEFGSVWVNCSHTDAKGTAWNAY
ncbi:MAG: RDD family protein [Elusimicrobia bacterium]|nr:RDD family protein [Elusimicrobiota bacterium]